MFGFVCLLIRFSEFIILGSVVNNLKSCWKMENKKIKNEEVILHRGLNVWMWKYMFLVMYMVCVWWVSISLIPQFVHIDNDWLTSLTIENIWSFEQMDTRNYLIPIFSLIPTFSYITQHLNYKYFDFAFWVNKNKYKREIMHWNMENIVWRIEEIL